MIDNRKAASAQVVKEIFDTWVAAYNAASVERVMSVFSPGVIYSGPCVPDKRFDALAAWFKFDFARSGPRPHWVYEVEQIIPGADLTVVVSRWAGFTDFGKKGLQAKVSEFRSVDVLKLGADGWKVVRTVNGPETCCPPPGKRRKRTK
jgi:ketosteroid isomerase-like protein